MVSLKSIKIPKVFCTDFIVFLPAKFFSEIIFVFHDKIPFQQSVLNDSKYRLNIQLQNITFAQPKSTYKFQCNSLLRGTNLVRI